MNRFNNFIKTSLIGGTAVILPVALSVFLLNWLFKTVINIIEPLTLLVVKASDIQIFFANILVVTIILLACFIVGVIVKTQLGRFVQESLEDYILNFAPGYSIIKETVLQFLGRKSSPFSSVVLVQAYENSTLMTGFITDEYADGRCSVFVPTGPNPTTGYILHLKPEYVHRVKVSPEEAIRSVISCGAGSEKLLKAFAEKEHARGAEKAGL